MIVCRFIFESEDGEPPPPEAQSMSARCLRIGNVSLGGFHRPRVPHPAGKVRVRVLLMMLAAPRALWRLLCWGLTCLLNNGFTGR